MYLLLYRVQPAASARTFRSARARIDVLLERWWICREVICAAGIKAYSSSAYGHRHSVQGKRRQEAAARFPYNPSTVFLAHRSVAEVKQDVVDQGIENTCAAPVTTFCFTTQAYKQYGLVREGTPTVR